MTATPALGGGDRDSNIPEVLWPTGISKCPGETNCFKAIMVAGVKEEDARDLALASALSYAIHHT